MAVAGLVLGSALAGCDDAAPQPPLPLDQARTQYTDVVTKVRTGLSQQFGVEFTSQNRERIFPGDQPGRCGYSPEGFIGQVNLAGKEETWHAARKRADAALQDTGFAPMHEQENPGRLPMLRSTDSHGAVLTISGRGHVSIYLKATVAAQRCDGT